MLTLEGNARWWCTPQRLALPYWQLKQEFIKHFSGITSYEANLQKFRALKYDPKETLQTYANELQLYAQSIGNYLDPMGQPSREFKTQFKLGLPAEVQKGLLDLTEDATMEDIIKRAQKQIDMLALTAQASSVVPTKDITSALGMAVQPVEEHKADHSELVDTLQKFCMMTIDAKAKEKNNEVKNSNLNRTNEKFRANSPKVQVRDRTPSPRYVNQDRRRNSPSPGRHNSNYESKDYRKGDHRSRFDNRNEYRSKDRRDDSYNRNRNRTPDGYYNRNRDYNRDRNRTPDRSPNRDRYRSPDRSYVVYYDKPRQEIRYEGQNRGRSPDRMYSRDWNDRDQRNREGEMRVHDRNQKGDMKAIEYRPMTDGNVRNERRDRSPSNYSNHATYYNNGNVNRSRESSPSGRRGRPSSPGPNHCWHCGETDHMMRNCPVLFQSMKMHFQQSQP